VSGRNGHSASWAPDGKSIAYEDVCYYGCPSSGNRGPWDMRRDLDQCDGVQGADRVPKLLVAIPIGDGKTVILDGTPGDAAGYRQQIAIARTMRAVGRSP
jgi:hypothetical protein